MTVGDDSRLEERVKLRVASFEPGVLVLRPITVRARCTVGTQAILGGGCELLDGAHVAPYRSVEAGTVVPAETVVPERNTERLAPAGSSSDHGEGVLRIAWFNG